jgi:hypothetical protein
MALKMGAGRHAEPAAGRQETDESADELESADALEDDERVTATEETG